MKKISLTIVLILSCSFVFAQPLGSPIAISNRLDGNLFNFYAQNNSRVDYAEIKIPKEQNQIEGTVYAFKGWNNRGLLNVDSRDYKLDNVNFNISTNTLEAKVGKDSLYIFDLANIDHAYINNTKLKNFYYAATRENKIFEVIYESEDLYLLKGYNIVIEKKEVDPTMVRNRKAKYVKGSDYYIREGNNTKKIALKKKYIMPLFKDKSVEVNNFAKENKLSYKKDQDLKKMFLYYKQL